MNLKLIIFDMDGVILDSERVANLAWFEVSKKYNLGLTLESLREIKGGTTTRTKGLLSERVGVELAEKIMKEKREIQLDIIKNEGGIKLKKGVVELLEYIKEKKLKCEVATSTSRESAKKQLKETGVYDYFDTLVFGNEVENSVLGATAANRAGIKCLVVEDTIKFTEEENKLAYRKFGSLLEIKKLEILI